MEKQKKINVTQIRYREALQQIVAGCVNPEEVAREALRHHRAENRTDLVGWRFSRLLVIFYAGMRKRLEGKSERKRSTWLCMCDCGKLVHVEGNAMMAGNTKSCGCWKIEHMQQRFFKHGRYSKRAVTLGLPQAGHPGKARILDCPPARLDATE